MLLRSSSSPLLVDCLVAAQTEPCRDAKAEMISPSGTLHRTRSGNHLPAAASRPRLHLDSPIASPRLSEPWPPSSNPPSASSSRMRKAASAGDLSSLGGGAAGSVQPAHVAANTFLQEPSGDCCSVFPSPSCALPSSKKSRDLLPLSRQMSLGSLPSELPFICFNGGSAGNDLVILEEGEILSSCSSDASEIEASTCAIDKIALPVGKFTRKRCSNSTELGEMHEEQQVSIAILQKGVLQGVEVEDSRMTGRDEIEMVASSSGRCGRDGELRQSHAPYQMARSSNVYTIERACEAQTSPRSVFGGDSLETVLGGGDGGIGRRRPAVTGGGGGGSGDGGNHGGSRSSSVVSDQHYQQVLRADPGNPLLLRNYAQYLSDVKQEYAKAEEFYQRAILASPGDGELLGQYAKMLWEVGHDAERAASYFERAVQAAPDNSYVMAAYASFLWSSEEEQEIGGSSTSDFPVSFPSLVSAGPA